MGCVHSIDTETNSNFSLGWGGGEKDERGVTVKDDATSSSSLAGVILNK